MLGFFLGGGLITHLGELNPLAPRRLGSGFLSCCFNAYMVNKFHDNEHCSCSISVCGIKRGRFAIHRFGTMLKVEGLEKRLGLGLARSRSRDKNQTSRSRGNAGRSWSRTKNQMSRSRKLRSRLHPCDSSRNLAVPYGKFALC